MNGLNVTNILDIVSVVDNMFCLYPLKWLVIPLYVTYYDHFLCITAPYLLNGV